MKKIQVVRVNVVRATRTAAERLALSAFCLLFSWDLELTAVSQPCTARKPDRAATLVVNTRWVPRVMRLMSLPFFLFSVGLVV